MLSSENQSQKNVIGTINILADSDDEDEETITIKLNSNSIEVNYNQLCKYSKLIREDYTIHESRSSLSSKLQDFEDQYNIPESSTILFFKLVQKEDIEITGSEYFDLFDLASFFKSNQIKKILKRTLEKNSEDIEFILKIIQNNKLNETQSIVEIDDLYFDFEQMLKNRVNECLQNGNFGALNISMVYRIIELGQKDTQTSDLLFDFIMKNIDERFILFRFVEIRNLSDEKFEELRNGFIESKNSGKSRYYEYLKLDLDHLQNLKEANKNQKNKIVSLNSEIERLKKTAEDTASENSELKRKVFVPNMNNAYIEMIRIFEGDVENKFVFYACLTGNFEFVKQFISLDQIDITSKTVYIYDLFNFKIK